MRLYVEPPLNCNICSRLSAFRQINKSLYPSYYNAPVHSMGKLDSELILVGLAPGIKGANKTGRPFTGDYAGDLLFSTLLKHGFARGMYEAHPNDSLELINCRITNAVKCVPPKNKPIGAEVSACCQFLTAELAKMPQLKVILALGVVAHGAILTALGERKGLRKFGHHKIHKLQGGVKLINSYHCSRYNTNTGRLTEKMFGFVFDTISQLLKENNQN